MGEVTLLHQQFYMISKERTMILSALTSVVSVSEEITGFEASAGGELGVGSMYSKLPAFRVVG